MTYQEKIKNVRDIHYSILGEKGLSCCLEDDTWFAVVASCDHPKDILEENVEGICCSYKREGGKNGIRTIS